MRGRRREQVSLWHPMIQPLHDLSTLDDCAIALLVTHHLRVPVYGNDPVADPSVAHRRFPNGREVKEVSILKAAHETSSRHCGYETLRRAGGSGCW